jgi:hypothetical protein
VRSDLGGYRDNLARATSLVTQKALETPARIVSGQREIAISSASISAAGTPQTSENHPTASGSEEDTAKNYEWTKMAVDLSAERAKLILNRDLASAKEMLKNNTMSAQQFRDYSRSVEDTKSIISGLSKVLTRLDWALSAKKALNADPGKNTSYHVAKPLFDFAADQASNAAQKGIVAVFQQLYPNAGEAFFEGVVGTTFGIGTILLSSEEISAEPLEIIRDDSGKHSIEQKTKALGQLLKWSDHKGPAVVPDADVIEAYNRIQTEKKNYAQRRQ